MFSGWRKALWQWSPDGLLVLVVLYVGGLLPVSWWSLGSLGGLLVVVLRRLLVVVAIVLVNVFVAVAVVVVEVIVVKVLYR